MSPEMTQCREVCTSGAQPDEYEPPNDLQPLILINLLKKDKACFWSTYPWFNIFNIQGMDWYRLKHTGKRYCTLSRNITILNWRRIYHQSDITPLFTRDSLFSFGGERYALVIDADSRADHIACWAHWDRNTIRDHKNTSKHRKVCYELWVCGWILLPLFWTPNSLPLRMWSRKFFSSDGLMFIKLSVASSST